MKTKLTLLLLSFILLIGCHTTGPRVPKGGIEGSFTDADMEQVVENNKKLHQQIINGDDKFIFNLGDPSEH